MDALFYHPELGAFLLERENTELSGDAGVWIVSDGAVDVTWFRG